MSAIKATHDPNLPDWIDSRHAMDTDFLAQNLVYACFSVIPPPATAPCLNRHYSMRIGHCIVGISTITDLFQRLCYCCSQAVTRPAGQAHTCLQDSREILLHDSDSYAGFSRIDFGECHACVTPARVQT